MNAPILENFCVYVAHAREVAVIKNMQRINHRMWKLQKDTIRAQPSFRTLQPTNFDFHLSVLSQLSKKTLMYYNGDMAVEPGKLVQSVSDSIIEFQNKQYVKWLSANCI